MKTTTKTTILGLGAILAALGLAGCNHMAKGDMAMAAPMDGQIATPANYQSWPKFVQTVDKAAAGQVREIYMNTMGTKMAKGDAFPNGTESVMEIYAAKMGADGKPVMNGNGRLIKGDLKKVFVMKKGEGWGAAQPAGTVDNGDWVYAAYEADGTTPAKVDFNSCRGCHAPPKDADYVARYDEHFAM